MPTRFGGTPRDYQLVEEPDGSGNLRLTLYIHPSVGPLDNETVRRVFLQAIAQQSDAAQLMGLVWRAAGVLRIERRRPLLTPSGKILHLHVRN